MAEPATLARPYAEAAFAIARDAQALETWAEALHLAAALIAESRVAAALANPRLDPAARATLLLSLGGERFSGAVREFLRVLVQAERVALLPTIAALFDTLKNEAEAVATAQIESAFALTPAQVDALKTALQRRFGKTIEAQVVVNPVLLGGARITVGDTVLDVSVAAKLEALRARLRA